MTRAEAKRRVLSSAASMLEDIRWRPRGFYRVDDGIVCPEDAEKLAFAWQALVEELRRRGERRKKGARK